MKPGVGHALLFGLLAVAGATRADVVGYFDMCSGPQLWAARAIERAGHTAVPVSTPSATNLAGLAGLFVTNCSNTEYGGAYLSQRSAIEAAVRNGMALIIHDRHVTEAWKILPGWNQFHITRETGPNARDINVIDFSTTLTAGPGGLIGHDTLDKGTSSNHGYAAWSSLPPGAQPVLSRANRQEVVTFSYPLGAGNVVYSTIPLDYYLMAEGTSWDYIPAFWQIYAPNVIAYGVGWQPPVPTADAGPDQTVDEGLVVQLDGSGSSDPQGDPLNFAWTQLEGPLVTLQAPDSQRPWFIAPMVDTDTVLRFQLRVDDGVEVSEADEVRITVRDVNSPPVADAGADRVVECSGTVTPVLLDGSASYDPDDDPLSYLWSGQFGSVSGVSARVELVLGSHPIELTVSDDKEATATDSLLVEVVDTTLPGIQVGPDRVLEAESAAGTAYVVDPVVTDACGTVNVTITPAPPLYPIGETRVVVTATDLSGNTAEESLLITVRDTTPPVVTAPADVTVVATGLLTPVNLGEATAYDAVGVVAITHDAPAAGFATGENVVLWQATDAAGNMGRASQQVTILNVDPEIAGAAGGSLTEGGSFTATGEVIDPNSTGWTLRVDYGDGTGVETVPVDAASRTFALTHRYLDDGVYTVRLEVTDNHGGSGSATLKVEVLNAPPIPGEPLLSATRVGIDTPVRLTLPFVDPGILDRHTATVEWGDGSVTGAVVSSAGGSGRVTAEHAYAEPGVYRIRVVVTDNAGASAEAVVDNLDVYDPGLFATGGGWVDTGEGKLNFGFTARYDRNAEPQGNLQLHVGKQRFHAETLDRLVVAGSELHLGGSGRLNGISGYRFTLLGIGEGEGARLAVRVVDPAGKTVTVVGQEAPVVLGGGTLSFHEPAGNKTKSGR